MKSLLFLHPLYESVLELQPLWLLNRGGLGPVSDQASVCFTIGEGFPSAAEDLVRNLVPRWHIAAWRTCSSSSRLRGLDLSGVEGCSDVTDDRLWKRLFLFLFAPVSAASAGSRCVFLTKSRRAAVVGDCKLLLCCNSSCVTLRWGGGMSFSFRLGF